jgi:hypothetical protein
MGHQISERDTNNRSVHTIRRRLAGTLPFYATEQYFTFIEDTKQSFPVSEMVSERFMDVLKSCVKVFTHI